MEKGKRIAVYSRKSKFTGKGESVGNQVELCREYISAHEGEAALEDLVVYEDEGFSGGNLNRPAFRRMMQAARERQLRAIIVYRLDRISRNISDFSALIETLSRLQVDFISIREQFDTGTPMGRAMMYIASVFSQLERETIAERIRDNMRELAKTGRWLGGVTPTGFASESVKSVTLDGRTKKTCRLKLLPGEAETVRTIYELYAENQSLTGTEAELIRRRMFTKNGKRFTRFSIRGILQNPVYLTADQAAYDYFAGMGAELCADREAFDGKHGVLAYHRTDQEKGRATVCLPVREWIIAVGEHPGLVRGEIWVSVQKALEQNRSKSFRRPRSNEALLTGLIYCRCGERMHPKLSGRAAADGKPAFSYVCGMKERSRRALCNGRNAGGNALDAAVIERLKALKEQPEELIDRLESGGRQRTDRRGARDARLASLRQEKAELDKKTDALVDSLAEVGDGGARSRVIERMERMQRESEDVGTRIRELADQLSPRALTDAELEGARKGLAAFGVGLDGLTVGQKRAVVRALVSRVVWDGETAQVTLSGAEDASKTMGREDSK